MENDKKPTNTRWKLTKIILVLATVSFFLPAVINFILQFFLVSFTALVLLSAAEWVTVVSLIIGVYTSGNIMQDHIFKDAPQTFVPKKDDDKKLLEEDEGD